MRRLRENLTNIPTRVTLDSSVLLAYLLGEELSELVGQLLEKGGRRLYIPHTAITETYYIACRQLGSDTADRIVTSFLDGLAVETVSSEELDLVAGRCKCERSISLADCYVIAAAKLRDAAALFAEPESELTKEMKSHSFDVDIMFLSELLGTN